MPQNQFVSKKVDSQEDIKCGYFLLKTVEIKGWQKLWCWYMWVSSSLKYSIFLTPMIVRKESCWRRQEKGETRNKVETLEVLLGLINYGCIKYTFFFKKGNSNWQNEPGRQKKDKTYGHIAKSQTFSPLEGLKCLHNVKMK